VLKPCVSAGAKDTFQFGAAAECDEPTIEGRRGQIVRDADGTWTTFQRGRDFMLQPFIPEIQEIGEWSLVYFAGEFSHALLKNAGEGDWLVQDEFGGVVTQPAPPTAVRECGDAVMRTLRDVILPAHGGAPLLYARVDVVPRAAGPALGELELFEPELFFWDRSKAGRHIKESAGRKFHTALLALLDWK
jgi:hypothetical protein